jgi:hypothetical protein
MASLAALVIGAFSDREAVGLQLLYDFPRLQCELGRFTPSAGNGSLYAGDLVREPPTASRCLGGVGVGMSADRTTAALTSERTAEPLLAAARALTLEMWIRPSAADLREERLAPIFALHSPSAATIGSCGQHDEASLVVSQSSIGGRPVLKVQLAQAWFSSFTNVHRCLEFTVVDGDSGGWRGGAPARPPTTPPALPPRASHLTPPTTRAQSYPSSTRRPRRCTTSRSSSTTARRPSSTSTAAPAT